MFLFIEVSGKWFNIYTEIPILAFLLQAS